MCINHIHENYTHTLLNEEVVDQTFKENDTAIEQAWRRKGKLQTKRWRRLAFPCLVRENRVSHESVPATLSASELINQLTKQSLRNPNDSLNQGPIKAPSYCSDTDAGWKGY